MGGMHCAESRTHGSITNITWLMDKNFPPAVKLLPTSVAVQPGLLRTWSKVPKKGFLVARLVCFISAFFSGRTHDQKAN